MIFEAGLGNMFLAFFWTKKKKENIYINLSSYLASNDLRGSFIAASPLKPTRNATRGGRLWPITGLSNDTR